METFQWFSPLDRASRFEYRSASVPVLYPPQLLCVFLIRSSSLPWRQQGCSPRVTFKQAHLGDTEHRPWSCTGGRSTGSTAGKCLAQQHLNGRYRNLISIFNCGFPLIKSSVWRSHQATVALLSAWKCFWSDPVFFLDVSAAASLPGCLFSYRSQQDESLWDSYAEQMRVEELRRPGGKEAGAEKASRYLLSNFFTLNFSKTDAQADNSYFGTRGGLLLDIWFYQHSHWIDPFSILSQAAVDRIPSAPIKYITVW